MTISFREFINTDPPLMVDIWRKQRRFRGMVDRISHSMVDDLILAKPYFDRQGLILAFEGEQPIGFVQAGFCPNQDFSDVDMSQGVVSQLRVIERDDTPSIAASLLALAEDYLRQKGSTRVFGGGRFPHAPYYHGLYGGSRIPGILVDDTLMINTFTRGGYQPQGEVIIFQRRLAGFRAHIDRQQMSVRRQYQVHADTDPKFQNWWEACTTGFSRRTRFELTDRTTSDFAASVTFWDIQPLASCWGVHAMGMNDLNVAAEHRRCGLATFLLGESMRILAQESVGLVEAQSLVEDTAVCGVFSKHGFEIVGKGSVLAKKL